MRLANGVVWPIPVILQVAEETIKNFTEGENISLSYKSEIHAILHLEEVYLIDKENLIKKIFGTDDLAHPGVKKFLESGNCLLGGKITLLKRVLSEHKIYGLTPKQTRKIFSEMGWRKIVGFHTRNVAHRSHEFMHLEGLKRGFCDG